MSERWYSARNARGRVVKRRVTDLRTLRDSAHANPLLAGTLREAANEIEELRGRLYAACEPCAECGHIDYRELDDMVPPRATVSSE